MNENIKAGADIHAGDGGYSLGTQKAHDEFVKARNRSLHMNERIRELAQEAGLYVDVNGKPWPRNMNGEDIEGAYQKFAELVVKECLDFLEKDAAAAPDNSETQAALLACALDILDHFDIELED